ncbi:UDP-N-acetyl-D-mannosaminuronate dehydrogenase [Halalkaliarchaeum sp. AArc-CO]|uniref:nucleotide sugar dehydrogenase n=1 Tax=Halalkaliarchaeum sp. AArc-CO TaxID=2866381 RepID=UPI00217D5FEB|nr:nucleotide sugar dehydrogenase [Halalkaliarchaeum sp. AArc-CO]UWG50181.1 UDP-N-acetyl-D-mannosaminuronate dehydrogenase [Halalkaliarchaeum sp. AArc-CO]
MSSVCVHGLGYIGLPTAAMLANYDHDVSGYDADTTVISELRDGEIHLDEPGLRAFVTQALESGKLELVEEIVPAKYHVVCVPTPFDSDEKAADLSYVRAVGDAVAPVLRTGDTVILESTVPPGTTTGTLQPILEESGLTAGDDFALVHCPETVLPGNIITELRQNARIVGGVNGISTESAVHLYDSFVEGEIHTTADPTTAEFVKLIQNTFRDTNIGLANEIARLANDYGIDSREAIEMANEHPRVDILQPGPGVGGHCLPVDPWFLGVDSDELDLIATARQVNDGMVEFVAELLAEEVNSLAGTRIAILGVAYKGNVGDTRMSPGLRLARELQHGHRQAVPATDGGSPESPAVAIHDPHVEDPTLDLQTLEAATIDADAVVIATGHDEFGDLDPHALGERMAQRTIIDTKAILDPERWREAGFTVRRI